MEFTFAKLVITLELEADVTDPLALFGLRTSFEEAFKEAVGCRRADTVGCDCPFHRTFARALSPDPAALRRFQKPSLPFVFDIPRLPPFPNRGAMVELGLILVGDAAQHVPAYLTALRRLCHANGVTSRLPARLVMVESVGEGGVRQLVQNEDGELYHDRLGFLSLQGLQRAALATPQTLALSLVTPLRLMHEGRPLRQLSFSSLARALMRRVSSLAYYYGGIELDDDFQWLARESEMIDSDTAALRWVDWRGGSGGIRASGFVGRAVFRGDLTDFQHFFLLGEYVHLGKGAAYGLGAYRIEKIS